MVATPVETTRDPAVPAPVCADISSYFDLIYDSCRYSAISAQLPSKQLINNDPRPRSRHHFGVRFSGELQHVLS